MPELTKKQRAFVVNKVAGVANRDAAIAAGYSVAGAAVAADKLMRNPAIRTAIKATTKDQASAAPSDKPAMPRDRYDDPMAFLQDVMNHDGLPIAMRADAAKQLLPYQHARLGEKGKKESKKENAREASRGGKFSIPKAPPTLHVVRNDRE